MVLLDGEELGIASGEYQLTYTMTAGTAKLQQSVDDKEFQDIPYSDMTESTMVLIEMTSSTIRAVLTGDATVSLNKITIG